MQERTDNALEKFKNPDNDERGVWTSGDLTSKTKAAGHSYIIISPSGKEFYPPEGRQWAPAYETYLKLKNGNRLWFGENGDNVPRQKQFLSEIQAGVVPTTIMFHSECGHNQEAKKELISILPGIGNTFETPKPSRLLVKLMNLVNFDKNDIVLDFFSGSATTAHAVMRLNAEDGGNRRFIMVQLPEVCDEKSEAAKNGYSNICEIGKERIRRAGKKLLDEGVTKVSRTDKPVERFKPNITADGMMEVSSQMSFVTTIENIIPTHLDIGFRVFKLDSSNIQTWDSTPIDPGNLDEVYARMDTAVENLKLNRSDADLVYEILLKLGYPLTAEIAISEIGGLPVYTVEQAGLGTMLICLQSGVTAEVVEKLAALAPRKIVLAEKALADNSAMANAHYLLKNRDIELKIV